MGLVADAPSQAGDAFGRVTDGEVVDQWPQEAGAGSASERYFVGNWLGHSHTFTPSGMRRPHSGRHLTRVRYATVEVDNESDSPRVRR